MPPHPFACSSIYRLSSKRGGGHRKPPWEEAISHIGNQVVRQQQPTSFIDQPDRHDRCASSRKHTHTQAHARTQGRAGGLPDRKQTSGQRSGSLLTAHQRERGERHAHRPLRVDHLLQGLEGDARVRGELDAGEPRAAGEQLEHTRVGQLIGACEERASHTARARGGGREKRAGRRWSFS